MRTCRKRGMLEDCTLRRSSGKTNREGYFGLAASTHSTKLMFSVTTAGGSGVGVVESSFETAGSTVGIGAVVPSMTVGGRGGCSWVTTTEAKHY
jgi:hypothetical protein